MDSNFPLLQELHGIYQKELALPLVVAWQTFGPWTPLQPKPFLDPLEHARPLLEDFCRRFLMAKYKIQLEVQTNPTFAAYLERQLQHPGVKRLDWITYLKSPISQLQRSCLQLHTMVRALERGTEQGPLDEESSVSLQQLREVLEQMNQMTRSCDEIVWAAENTVEIEKLRVSFEAYHQKNPISRSIPSLEALQLDNQARQIIEQCTLFCRLWPSELSGSVWRWCRVILLDHTLVVADIFEKKRPRQRAKKQGDQDEYIMCPSLIFSTRLDYPTLSPIPRPSFALARGYPRETGTWGLTISAALPDVSVTTMSETSVTAEFQGLSVRKFAITKSSPPKEGSVKRCLLTGEEKDLTRLQSQIVKTLSPAIITKPRA